MYTVNVYTCMSRCMKLTHMWMWKGVTGGGLNAESEISGQYPAPSQKETESG